MNGRRLGKDGSPVGTARLNSIEVAVDVRLRQPREMIRRPPGQLGSDPFKSRFGHFKAKRPRSGLGFVRARSRPPLNPIAPELGQAAGYSFVSDQCSLSRSFPILSRHKFLTSCSLPHYMLTENQIESSHGRPLPALGNMDGHVWDLRPIGCCISALLASC